MRGRLLRIIRDGPFPGHFAAYELVGEGYDEVILPITKEEFERLKGQGVRVTGWWLPPAQRTLDDFFHFEGVVG